MVNSLIYCTVCLLLHPLLMKLFFLNPLITLFSIFSSGHFSVLILHNLTKILENVSHFFLPKTLSPPDSMTVLSLDSPLTYLAVPSNLLIPLLSFCQMLGVLRFCSMSFIHFIYALCSISLMPIICFTTRRLLLQLQNPYL